MLAAHRIAATAESRTAHERYQPRYQPDDQRQSPYEREEPPQELSKVPPVGRRGERDAYGDTPEHERSERQAEPANGEAAGHYPDHEGDQKPGVPGYAGILIAGN